MEKYPNINRNFTAPKTLGQYRRLALIILKEHNDIPNRATLFTNPAGQLHINWKSAENMEAIAKADVESAKAMRIQEADKIKFRLKELETLGL